MENILAIIGIILGIINLIILLINILKVNKYQKMYDNSLAKFNNTANIKDKFVELFTRLAEVEQKAIDTKEFCEKIQKETMSNIKKIGLVKYNAYDETENKLSFALAMLDDNNNGILLNHIYSVHGSNIYIKAVNNGKVKERISEQESIALQNATNKEVERIEENMPVVKKVNKKALSRSKNK